MRARAEGIVEAITDERADAQEVRVRVGDSCRRAVVYPALTGHVEVGDRVTLNTWAVELGLGTGGVDFVCAVQGRELEAEPPGHVMKLRYTPLQHPVLAAAAPESPWHDALSDFTTLDGTPVVCAELHSQLPAIAAAAKWETRGNGRVVYVMTDGAALPIGFSRTVAVLRERGLLDATVTAGQAFGGDFEAVNLYSALAVAKCAAGADIILVCQGPGNTGTDTCLGFSGIDQGVGLNAAASLDGIPIAAVRLSFADPRPRHIGISHHTRTVLERIALRPVVVPVPRLTVAERYNLRSDLDQSAALQRHEFITVDAEVGLDALIAQNIPVSTMGRGIEQERAFFLAAAAAGLVAGQWACAEREAVERL